MADQISGLDCELTSIPINGKPILLWRPIGAENYILQTVQAEFGEDERLPYWAMLWPAGIALAECVEELIGKGNRSVLELGAGLSLPSLAAARAGARVVATDWYMDPLAYAAASAKANGLDVECKFLDWRHPPHWPQFDLIIGADLLYERRNFGPILATLDQLLAPAGIAVFSDPERHMSLDFFLKASDSGWECVASTRAVHWEGGDFSVQCWEMRRV